jgi:hypothetical protein
VRAKVQATQRASHSGLLESRGLGTVRNERGVLDNTTLSVMPWYVPSGFRSKQVRNNRCVLVRRAGGLLRVCLIEYAHQEQPQHSSGEGYDDAIAPSMLPWSYVHPFDG